MRKTFASLVAVCAAAASHAAIIELDFAGNLMTGLNERPTPVLISGTGGELTGFMGEPSMSYDTDLDQIFINIGWGSANSYSDLTSGVTGAHIHGPADDQTAASVLYHLTSLVNDQGGGSGGIFQETIQLVDGTGGFTLAQQEQQLLDGLWYINIHTTTNPGGEIRGQLVAIPEPHEYAMIAAVGLLGFAGYRRYKNQQQVIA